MARVSNKHVVEQRQDAAQPPLFDESQLPVCLPVLENIRTRAYEHQGVRLLEDDGKTLKLVELLTLKWGVKKISAEMAISPHTVRAARRALVTQGKLAPYKQRVVEMMEDAIEAGVGNYRDALEGNFVPAAQIPVGIGIIFDKRALAMGEPTHLSGTAGATDDTLKVEDLNAYLERLPSCKIVETGVSDDSQSTEQAGKGQQTEAGVALDATLDAGQGRSSGSGQVDGRRTEGERATAEPLAGSGTGGDQAAEGGGGGRTGPAPD